MVARGMGGGEDWVGAKFDFLRKLERKTAWEWIEKEPWPSGPRGIKQETMASRVGTLHAMRRHM
jgi:hypothetical protein